MKTSRNNKKQVKAMSIEGDKKGLVLVAVLWVVVVLTVIVATVGRTSRLDTKLCLARTESLRCKWACRAGIDTAIAVLNEDTRESDTLLDLWNDNDQDLNDVDLERCFFAVQVIDEASKLNINAASKAQLLTLYEMTEEIADAIIDWRDADDTPGQGGVEGGYYENMPYRYTIRNGSFRTIRELLLVRDVAEELFYGQDSNFNTGSGADFEELNVGENRFADLEQEVMRNGWITYLTCYSYDKNKDVEGQNRVNINEANENSLTRSLRINRAYAKWIVENRGRNGYSSISDLINNRSPKRANRNSQQNSDQAAPLDLETFSNIADKITITNDAKVIGKVNINTASKVVLVALLGGTEAAEKVADEIIAYRESLIEGMQSIAEVMKVQSVNVDTFKRIANYITTRSDVYTIRCLATADRNGTAGVKLQTETVVDRSSMPFNILYWHQGVSN
ncbi:MAG: helix-hairpin-helix domain-containing protein [Planctomycetota bacterium]|jgi:type II secretory pathway component PulK